MSNEEQQPTERNAGQERSAANFTEDQADGGDGTVGESRTAAYGETGPVQAELDALRDRYLRLAAEYENYRRRTERERTEGRDRAQGQIVEQLLEPLDDLQRVAQYDPASVTVDSLLEGVRLVERKLLRALESAGLEAVEAKGQRFDPGLHDALVMTPTGERDEDETVGEVFQPGYRFRGSLLRPARVQVRKYED